MSDFVRVRSAQDRGKAFGIYNELRKSGKVEKALIIAQLKDGSWQVLGSGMVPDEMNQALLVGATGLNKVVERSMEVRPEVLRASEPEFVSGDRPLPQRHTKNPDGTLEPPLGEGWTSCGECKHPRWYVTHDDLSDAVRRMVCAHCGNNVALVQETGL